MCPSDCGDPAKIAVFLTNLQSNLRFVRTIPIFIRAQDGLWKRAVDSAAHSGAGWQQDADVDRERLTRLATANFGVFTRAQARACGFSEYQVRRRIASGEWQKVLGSGLAFAGFLVTPVARDRAAQLSVPGSVLGACSAGRTWQLPVPDTEPHLYVGPHGTSRIADVHLIYEEPPRRDVYRFQGLPALIRPAAIVDSLRWLGASEAVALLDRALQQSWITMADLARRTGLRVGCRGTPQLVGLVRTAGGGERSAAERLLTGLLRKGGIEGWVANAEVSDQAGLIGVVDLAIPPARVAIEVDLQAHHVTPDRFQRDRSRQNRLVAAGWTVLRFTWRDLTDRPGYVLDTVRRLTGR
jgi:very-short-patch-repair endonuclease